MTQSFRADHVGSLLRPPELTQARLQHAEGSITDVQLSALEDEGILRALQMQKQAGIGVFTDGEYRRSVWSGAGVNAIRGVVPATASPAGRILGEWRGPASDDAPANIGQPMIANARISAGDRLVGRDAAFLKAHAPGPWKITIPGPMSMAGSMFEPGVSDAFYANRFELAEDIANILHNEAKALVEDGVSYLQLDSLHYVERITDATVRARMIEGGEDPDEYLDKLIELDNAALAGLRGSSDLTVGLHMCRGNNRSRWHAEGSYESIAEKAFQRLNVDRFLLEYDTDRAGGFEPLRFVPRDKVVVLGIISSKVPALESLDKIRRCIDEASKFISVDQLAISPQCGFASTMYGNLLTWDEQRRKLELVAETARIVFA